jgi:hypothetical protein
MRNVVFTILAILITGCAAGNKYDYRESFITLPVKSDNRVTVVLSVKDMRPYVLNGDKGADFVGLQRGGFGNPFDVTTASGRPLTEDMSESIEASLTDKGYKVVNAHGASDVDDLVNTALNEGADRIILLVVHNWKSDIYMSITLHSDMRLKIYDSGGDLLAENEMIFVEEVGGAMIGAEKNSREVTEEFAKRMGYMFNKENIRRALQ